MVKWWYFIAFSFKLWHFLIEYIRRW
jgi:hypothetical protein